MIDFTKEDFQEWQNNKVSRAVLKAFHSLIQEGMEELSHVAGENSVADSRRVGKLDGLREFTNITYYQLVGDDE